MREAVSFALNKQLNRPIKIRQFIGGMILEDAWGKVELKRVLGHRDDHETIWRVEEVTSNEDEFKGKA